MTRVGLRETDAAGCPRRLWVMLTLSDDELVGETGSLPQGLRLHLSQCESCRVLAERLLSVSQALGELAGVEPPEGLAGRADFQTDEALRAGAKLTGRVDIPDEAEHELAVAGVGIWRHYGRYAAAAVILAGVGLIWVSTQIGSNGQLAAKEPEGGAPQSAMAVRLAEEADKEGAAASLRSQPGSAVADGGVDGAHESEGEVEEGVTAPSRSRLGLAPAPWVRLRGHRHHSHIEAAVCEDPLCVRRGHVLPDLSERLIGIGPAFDVSSPVGSTGEPTKRLGDE